jgi:hypothetical protein
MGNNLSEVLAEATYLFTWHTAWLEPCEKCKRLEGRMYSEYTLESDYIYDGEFGNIWDIQNDMPLTHPNCKCFLEVEIFTAVENAAPFKELAKKLKNFDRVYVMPSNIKEMKTVLDEYDRDLQRVEHRMNNTRTQITRTLSLMNMMGLPPDVQRALSMLSRLQIAYMQTQQAALALMVVSRAASGPIGWAMAAVDVGIAVGSYYSIVATLGGQ